MGVILDYLDSIEAKRESLKGVGKITKVCDPI